MHARARSVIIRSASSMRASTCTGVAAERACCEFALRFFLRNEAAELVSSPRLSDWSRAVRHLELLSKVPSRMSSAVAAPRRALAS